MQKGQTLIFVLIGILILASGALFLTKSNGKICGGFAGEQGELACPVGYKCQYPSPIYPDASGKCVNILSTIFFRSSTTSPTPVVTSQTPQPSMTSDQTANWKQYSGSDFTFKYPSSWTFGAADPTYISLLDPQYSEPNCRGSCSVFTINFHVQKNFNNLDLETIIQNNYKSVAGSTGDYTKVKVEDFTDKNGVHYKKVIGMPGGGFFQLYTLQNNRIYILSPDAGDHGMLDEESDPKVKTNLAIFDQILSTFKFIK